MSLPNLAVFLGLSTFGDLYVYTVCNLDPTRSKEEQTIEGKLAKYNLRLLENKIKRLEGIIDILQNAKCTANAPLDERLSVPEQMYGKCSIHMLCDVLKVPRGTFYNHILRNKRGNTRYAERREALRVKIQEFYDESKQIF